MMAPGWLLLPMVLATCAAIIASQALISGAFSLTQQAVQLGYAPRLSIDHTSSAEAGQIYVPQVNWALMVATLAIAVTLTMIITALLLHTVAIERWKWPKALVFAITGLFLSVDLLFFGANALKIAQGGWLPLVIGGAIFTLMTTWKTGRRVVADRLSARSEPLENFLARLEDHPPARVPGTAVFITAQPHGTPPALAHNLRYNKVLHEHVVTLLVKTMPWPYVQDDERVTIKPLGGGVFDVTVYFGFMDDVDVPKALRLAQLEGLSLDADDTTYFLGRETLIPTDSPGMALWREHLFVLMARNAMRATGFFRLPAERVVELGVQVEL